LAHEGGTSVILNLANSKIVIYENATLPVNTAAEYLAAELSGRTGVRPEIRRITRPENGQEQIVALVNGEEQGHLGRTEYPAIQSDGFGVMETGGAVVAFGNMGRALVYAVYYLLENAKISGLTFSWDQGNYRTEPEFGIRNWMFYDIANKARKAGAEIIPQLALRHRLNSVSYSPFDKGVVGPRVHLDHAFPGFTAPFAGKNDEIRQRRQDALYFIGQAKKYGLEVFAGWAPLDFPEYVYEFIAANFPEYLAKGYKGSSDWPPYEWQERPKYCPAQEGLWQLWQYALHEFFDLHPELDGLVMAFYDGNQLGCGCPRCQNYEYADRYIDAIKCTNTVLMQRGKKMILFDWLPGGLQRRPGYDFFWKNLRKFVEGAPNITVATWETEGDFMMTHPPHPHIGDYPNQIPGFQLWPEYRGWGKVPDWMAGHMSERLNEFKKKPGVTGFYAIEGNLDDRINAVNFEAFGALTWDSGRKPEEIETEYCKREFGAAAAPLAGILRKCYEARCLYLYVNEVKFNGHSHLEYDLRTWEEVYVKYDGFFFDRMEERLDANPQNIGKIITDMDRAVAISEEMLHELNELKGKLSESDFRLVSRKLLWNLNYAKLWRGFARAFFHLKSLRKEGRLQDHRAAGEIIAGAGEMKEAYSFLPANEQQYGEGVYYDSGYPWSSPDLTSLIGQLRVAGELVSKIAKAEDIVVFGAGEAAEFFDQLFIPYRVVEEYDSCMENCKVLIVDGSATSRFNKNWDKIAAVLERGVNVLLDNPNRHFLAAGKLPGRIQLNVCQYASAKVIDRTHPVTRGKTELAPEPIFYFGATSAYLESKEFNSGIKTYAAADHTWKPLTYPGMLLEKSIGKGTLFVNLIPENRDLYLKIVNYLLGI
jgi:hypothetical protein